MSKVSTRKGTTATTTNKALEDLMTRRRKSSYPTDARTERQYWLRQIQTLLANK